MPKLKKMIETESGWTEPFHPSMKHEGLYRMGCCDCGLVHDVELKVVCRANRDYK